MASRARKLLNEELTPELKSSILGNKQDDDIRKLSPSDYINPETGYHYDIPGLRKDDPLYDEVYRGMMVLRKTDPYVWNKILNWD